MVTKVTECVVAEMSDDNNSMEEESINATDDENSGDNALESNLAWADSIANILKSNKPKRKRTLVLSRAKKITDLKKETTRPAGYELETVEGEIKEEKVPIKIETVETPKEIPRKKKKELPNLRVKPNVLEKARERTLMKIATKGVVQLFNSVRNQQKDISHKLKEAGPLEVKKDKVLKSIDKKAFLDVLMGDKAKSELVDSDTKIEPKDEPSTKEQTWNVLRDDFMMGAKLKDWDKVPENDDSDSNME